MNIDWCNMTKSVSFELDVGSMKIDKVQSCKMSIFSHRANLPNQILPQEECVNRVKFRAKSKWSWHKGYFWRTNTKIQSHMDGFKTELHISFWNLPLKYVVQQYLPCLWHFATLTELQTTMLTKSEKYIISYFWILMEMILLRRKRDKNMPPSSTKSCLPFFGGKSDNIGKGGQKWNLSSTM